MAIQYYKDPSTGQWVKQAGGGGGSGKDGKSAYQYAVEAGFVGTEEEFTELLMCNSIKQYGAMGDGVTDDTAAFQEALANERVVSVPGGTYVLSDTLVIRPNCCLELSQDTILKFTQTEGNCIEMRSSAALRGNLGIVEVPYAFAGHVIDANTTHDTGKDTEPYIHWSPQWKRGRYIYDVCIVKANPSGLHYSTDGTCSGTAIYLSGDGNNEVRFIWGALLQGIRIAGAFTRGIHAINFDLECYEDSAWNHDMRIEAVIHGCETAVDLTNCNDVHLAVAVQPQEAENGTPYAKWGVYLNDCRYIDMSSSVIWDWNDTNSKYTPGGQYTAVAMYGNCCGLVLYDFGYYTNNTDTRDRIYTDTPSNLDKMTIVQEPITRWFKVKEGAPYYFDGNTEKKLIAQDEMKAYFDADAVKNFTDVLPTAIDTDGSVFNGVGYKSGYIQANGAFAEVGYNYCVATGFIPCKKGSKIYTEGMGHFSFDSSDCRIVLYDADFNYVIHVNRAGLITGSNYYVGYEETDNGFVCTLNSISNLNDVAYARFSIYHTDWGKYPMVSIDEEIKYSVNGFLADGVKVKGDNVILYSSSGKAFKLTIDDSGVITPVEYTE